MSLVPFMDKESDFPQLAVSYPIPKNSIRKMSMPIKDIEQTVCLKTASNQQSKCQMTRKDNVNIVHNIFRLWVVVIS